MKNAGARGITRSRVPFIAMLALAATIGLAGCEGDDGKDGATGAAGADGLSCWDLNQNGIKDPEEDLNKDGVVDTNDCNGLIGGGGPGEAIAAAKVESCNTCHGGAGDEHQSVYDDYIDTTLALDISNLQSVAAAAGGFDVTLTYRITKNGAGYSTPVESTSFYVVSYDSGTGEFSNAFGSSFPGLDTSLATSSGNGNYTLTQNLAFDPLALESGAIVGRIADRRLEIEARQAGKRIAMYGDLASDAWPIGNIGTFSSLADVKSCQRCHSSGGAKYRKHGNIEAVVANVPDFVHCKACHSNDRDGGHEEWQWMADDPLAWATHEGDLPAEIEAAYAYRAVLMNDVHMSHAMELPYPMSMANCATCHTEARLAAVLDNSNFTGPTCKSCHAVEGTGTWGAACDDNDDATKCYEEANRPPALRKIWTDAGVAQIHAGYDNTTILTANCQQCHGSVASEFSDYHNGYDKLIYTASGEKYADLYTASIDSVSVTNNVMDIRFSSNNTSVVPMVGVNFYGWDSKHYLVSQHTRDVNDVRMEKTIGIDNVLFTEEADSVAGNWHVTLDLAAYEPDDTDSIPDLIAAGDVKKAEVAVFPMLKAGEDDVALNAVTKTFDLASKQFVADYFQGAAAVADIAKCNSCHDVLGATFHSGRGRGGSIVACRTCHVVTSGGSHLEMQSRSIDSYAHAIHSFQAFDTDETDFTDPVEKARYDLHIEHAFPVFTAQACEGCHTTTAGVYEVPDQSESMPGLLSASYEWNVDRAFGSVPEYVTGPASRACGSCHRAEWINEDEPGQLAGFNSHTESFGTLSENDEDDVVLYGIIYKIMGFFE